MEPQLSSEPFPSPQTWASNPFVQNGIKGKDKRFSADKLFTNDSNQKLLPTTETKPSHRQVKCAALDIRNRQEGSQDLMCTVGVLAEVGGGWKPSEVPQGWPY